MLLQQMVILSMIGLFHPPQKNILAGGWCSELAAGILQVFLQYYICEVESQPILGKLTILDCCNNKSECNLRPRWSVEIKATNEPGLQCHAASDPPVAPGLPPGWSASNRRSTSSR